MVFSGTSLDEAAYLKKENSILKTTRKAPRFIFP